MRPHPPSHNPWGSAAVLLVDDDPDCRHLFRDAIAVGSLPCALYEVCSAAEAIRFCRRQGQHAGATRPTLVFTDVEMPGASGLELLEALKADPDLRSVPVIVLSGLRDPATMSAAARLGAADYIVKPVEPAAFVTLVAKATRYWLARALGRGGRSCPRSAR